MDTALPLSARRHLLSLKAKDDATFADELQRFQKLGWSSRMLSAALDVSHSYISVRISRATGDSPDTGYVIPARARPSTVLPVHELPQQMRDDLADRLTRAIHEHPAERGSDRLSPTVSSYFTALAAALAEGWDSHSIGVSIDVHPRTIPRFTQRLLSNGQPAPNYPMAPRAPGALAWNARHPSIPLPTVPESQALRLGALAGKAHRNRGVGDADSGPLSDAIEYTTLLAEWYLRGASRSELQRVTGQGWEALRKRLTRWGYMRSEAG